jgi:nitrogen-specific signal transduction histidine kinase
MALLAISIVALSIYFTNNMAQNIALQERNSVQIFALAQESIADIENKDNKLAFTIIQSNINIPVIITDSLDNILDTKNIKLVDSANLKLYMAEFKSANLPILSGPQKIYYGQSKLLERLKYFPYVLLTIVSLFLTIMFVAYNTANKALQNRVWVGLSKETAHQLGTPIMSLVGWLEYLKLKGHTMEVAEMEKDIDRLKLIADRFSKIGSVPQLSEENIVDKLENVIGYMRMRSPQKVEINFEANQKTYVPCMLNAPLFEWVIENLIRNSLDAMDGAGKIGIELQSTPTEIIVDVSDTGKGVPQNLHNKVFKPGFSTKKRGWGLGLSLAKRIITKYHRGNIYILKSDAVHGTTFRIKLHTAN